MRTEGREREIFSTKEKTWRVRVSCAEAPPGHTDEPAPANAGGAARYVRASLVMRTASATGTLHSLVEHPPSPTSEHLTLQQTLTKRRRNRLDVSCAGTQSEHFKTRKKPLKTKMKESGYEKGNIDGLGWSLEKGVVQSIVKAVLLYSEFRATWSAQIQRGRTN